jgi:2',3'-cyclic-nucleotide 2'-phosphodiesterase (5'-nucleotidase family)
LVLAAVILAVAVSPRAAEPAPFHLTILHANDFHGEDPAALARRATLIKRERAGAENVLLLDAGDVWTRGPYAKVFFGEMEFAAMNAMGYDAMTLGNNEFKATDDIAAQKYLGARIAQASFTMLCANVTLEAGGYLPGVRPYTVKTIGGARVGIMGLSAARIRKYQQTKGYIVADPLVAARTVFPELAARSDLVVALTHIGFGEDLRLARSVPGLAAIVGGDTHTVLAQPVEEDGVPIVQAGSKGRYLGRLDLEFTWREGRWVLSHYEGRLLRVDKTVPEDPEVKAIVEGFLAKAKKAA